MKEVERRALISKEYIIEKKKPRFVHPQVVKMFNRAQQLMHDGENMVALKLLNRCLELNPFDSHSWLAIARLESKLGNTDQARELFSRAVRSCPNNVHLLHAWGHMEQKHGNEVIARECFSQALELDPLNAYVCYALSSLEKKLRNFDRARLVLERVVWQRPNAAVCVALAELERQSGEPEKARLVLKHGLKKCGKDRSQLLLALAWLEEDAFRNIGKSFNLIQEAISVDPSNVKVYVAKASAELRLNRPDDARATLKRCSSLPSKDGTHFTMLATIEMESGNIDAARTALQEGAKHHPGDQFLLQRWGTFEALHGDVSRAREMFERSVAIKPHAPTFVAWAILEEQEGSRALAPLPQAIADTIINSTTPPTGLYVFPDEVRVDRLTLDPSLASRESRAAAQTLAKHQIARARLLFAVGLSVDPETRPAVPRLRQHGNGNVTGARSIFSAGIAANCSDSSSLYHALGLLELAEGRREEAGETFRRGIELGLRGAREVEHGVVFLLHSLGMLELDCERAAEAKRVFSTGISLFPHHSQMLLGLGMACLKLGESTEARQHFKASIDANPHHAHAWQSWAIAEKQSGNYELARILFRQGLKKNPTHGPLWQAFGVMEAQLGNTDAAKSLFSESLRRCPTHAQTYQAWACLELKLGNLQKAKALSISGIRLDRRHSALWTVAGLVELRMGNMESARRVLQSGLKLSPQHGPLYKALGELEARSGSYDRAREVLHRGMEVDPRCEGLYHSAALLEAKLGNIDGLSELHSKCRNNFGKPHEESKNDILAKIGAITSAARGAKEAGVSFGGDSDGGEGDLRSYNLDDDVDA